MEEPGEDGGQCSGFDYGESESICSYKTTLENLGKIGQGHPGAWILATGVEGAVGDLGEMEGLVVDKQP